MRSLLLAAVVAAALASGCLGASSQDADPGDLGALPSGDRSIGAEAGAGGGAAGGATRAGTDAAGGQGLRGVVVSTAIVPVANATVAVLALDLVATTGPDGRFAFDLPEGRLHVLHVSAPGFLDQNVTVTPALAQDLVRVMLEPGAPVVPYRELFHAKGVLQCAFEALIISPSCDSVLTAAGLPPVFDANATVAFGADPGWRSVVVDVVFDPAAHPGLAGLRATLRGTLDPDGGGEYQQYGRWHAPEAFTFHVAPGQTYTDGVEPVPEGAAGFQLDLYPHGHGYHQASNFLGVGAALDVRFDVYVTVFYVEPAPDGYSFQDA